MPVWPVSIYCTQCKWCKHRHWSYKVGGGGQCIKRRPRCFGVCQFIEQDGGRVGVEEGAIASTEILTKQQEQQQNIYKMRDQHFIIYTQYIFPPSAFLIPQVLLPLFWFSFSSSSLFICCAFGIKAEWTLVSSVERESFSKIWGCSLPCCWASTVL